MKVREFIEELKKLPQELEVMVEDEGLLYDVVIPNNIIQYDIEKTNEYGDDYKVKEYGLRLGWANRGFDMSVIDNYISVEDMRKDVGNRYD